MHSAKLHILFFTFCIPILGTAETFTITEQSPVYFTPDVFSQEPDAGDTIFITADRTKPLIFKDLSGSAGQPIVVINQGGQVVIHSGGFANAIDFRDCHHIKLSGRGVGGLSYGFKLSATLTGVAFSGLSSHCEIEFTEIDHDGFFGIMAKKDYGGNPPFPTPVFDHLIIHDCLIKNVTEGMYIGETKTPGMEFHHLRIYNNIVYATGREAVQISNATEDVAVYNNLFWKSGMDGDHMHGNNLQIGDNTVGRFYNNLLLDAKEHGIILMGSGDVEIYNNYLSNNKGIFIDERSVSIEDAPLTIRENYFYQMLRPECIRNRNEPNRLFIHDNQWQGAEAFLAQLSQKPEKTESWNNEQTELTPLPELSLQAPFTLPAGTPAEYLGMGPQAGLSFLLNDRPELNEPEDLVLNWDRQDTLVFTATVDDGDQILFQYSALPDFISVQEQGTGEVWLILQPDSQDEGIYELKVTAADVSHQDKSRSKLQLTVRNPNNQPPHLAIDSVWTLQNLSEYYLPVPCTDPEGHDILITAEALPAFAQLQMDNTGYALQLRPLFHQTGQYTFLLYACDAYGGADTLEITITVTQRPLNAGDPVVRINCGGPALQDSLLNWEDAYNQVTVYEVTPNHRTGSHSWSGENTTGAPDDLFGPFAREQPWGNQEMYWSVPCPAGHYEVNLYFAERQRDIDKHGAVIFDLYLNGERVLEDFNIYDEAGLAAVKKSFTVSLQQAGTIDLEFVGSHYKPKINGLEVRFLSAPPAALVTLRNPAPAPATVPAAPDIRVYPNPATDYLQVDWKAPEEQAPFQLVLIDAQGRPVKQIEVQAAGDTSRTIPLDRSGLPAGFYSLQLRNGGQPEVAAVVLQ